MSYATSVGHQVSHPLLNGRGVPVVELEEFKTDLNKATYDFVAAVRSFDDHLYVALAKIYHLYLLAMKPVPAFFDYLNNLVAQNLDKPDFNVAHEPTGNKFRYLISATLLFSRDVPGRNGRDIEKREANNTWSMALHYCLRQRWTPSEAYDELVNQGVRKLYDKEMRARANRVSQEDAKVYSDRLANAAIDALKTMSAPVSPIHLPGVLNEGDGLGLFFGRIRNDTVELLGRAPASEGDLTDYALKWFDSMRIDRAPAGAFIHLLRLGRRFLGDLSKCSGLIRTTPESTIFLLMIPGRTVKATSHLISVVPAALDGLGESMDYIVAGKTLNSIYNTSHDRPLAENWRFEGPMDDVATGKRDNDRFLVADFPDGPERWQISSLEQTPNNLRTLLACTVPETAFEISLPEWSRLREWIDETSGEEEVRRTKIQQNLVIREQNGEVVVGKTDDFGESEIHLDCMNIYGGGFPSFLLRPVIAGKLSELMALARSGSSVWYVSKTLLMVEVRTDRAAFTVHIRLDLSRIDKKRYS